MAFMRKFGIEASHYPYSQGIQLFVELKRRLDSGLATPRQMEVLGRAGYETKDMRYKDAKRLVDALKNNNWQRPATKVEVDESF